jgi:ADP-heptose:LPS heptosyltransferase
VTPKDSRRPILAIKLDGIGDFALALPALKGLANAYPQAPLDAVVSSYNASWREVVPWIRTWRTIDFRGYRLEEPRRMGKAALVLRLAALGLRLHLNRYQAALDLRTVFGDWRGKVIARLSGAPFRVGGPGDGEWALTHLSRETSVHQSDILLERLRVFDPALKKAGSGFVNVSRTRPKAAMPHLVFHPGAGNAAKRWPVENWIALARALAGRATVQLLGGPEDEARLREISAGAGLAPGHAHVSTTLRGTLQILADADLLVGLDSAAPHLAYLVGTPAITIFSAANDPARWKALGDNTVLFTPIECGPCELPRCKWDTHRCMDAITRKTVLSTIDNSFR